MSVVLILWSAVGGAALTMGGAHGALWLIERRRLANLAFCIVAIAVAGIAATEVGMMHSATPAEYGRWVRWFHLPNFFAVTGLVVFVRLQLGTGPAWLGALVIALRVVIVAINFSVEPNANWSEITSLRALPFLGEPVSVVGAGVARSTQWLGSLSGLLFIAYVVAAFAGAWRAPDAEARRKAAVICGGILAFIVLAILQTQLVIFGLASMPILVAPLFLIPLAAITWEVSRAIVVSVRTEREAAGLRDKLAHVSRVHTIGQLSGALAHELKQPLTSIMADAQAAQRLLQSDKPDMAEVRAILADIFDADRRADAIVERARTFMKVRASLPETVSLEALAREVVALAEQDAARYGVALEVDVPGDVPPVRGDRVQLSQVLLNLVVNGIDAVAAAGGKERRVRIEAARAGAGRVEVTVLDTGTGIPQDMLPRLFDAFVSTKPGGLGIGLALSRSIVQAYGGDLDARNNPGGGAAIRFTLEAA